MLELTTIEERAATALRPEAVQYISLCADTASVIKSSIEMAISQWDEVESLAAWTNIALLVRLYQDLRTASMLAGIGYSAQAVAIIASTFEIAFTVAYIGKDDSRAEEWDEHDDPRNLPQKVQFLVRTVMKEQGAPPEAAEGHYRLYRQLCMGKHGNPLFAKRQPFVECDERTIIHLEPRFEASVVRTLQFALEHAASLGALGVRAFMSCFGGEGVAALWERLEELEQRGKNLHDEAVARWGTDDPFPGKW